MPARAEEYVVTMSVATARPTGPARPSSVLPSSVLPNLTSAAARVPVTSSPADPRARRATAGVPVPAHMLPNRSPAELLTLARRGLSEAAQTPADGLRYACAHLAALRAAAAVLAALARPEPRRRTRLTSVWMLLVAVAPELAEWAAYFAAGASKRAAAEAGIARAVTAREANDLTRAAEQFVEVVAVTLGLVYQPVLDGLAS
jgi:SAV_6107-like HEPN